MNLFRIAFRIAAYDFRTKAMINALVIQAIAREAGLNPEDDSMNDVAIALADSPVHGMIQSLADAIHSEAEKVKRAH